MPNTIQSIYTLGQSVWYDNISRSMLNSGGLKDLIDIGVTGLTANPTIFENGKKVFGISALPPYLEAWQWDRPAGGPKPGWEHLRRD